MSDNRKRLTIHKLANSMSTAYSFGLTEKLTIVDIMILSILYRNPGITATEVSKELALQNVPFTTMQYSFISFKRMGLITKKPHPNDHKAKQVFLTRKGEQLALSIVDGFKKQLSGDVR